MTLSAYVPCLNNAATLRAAVQSVAQQLIPVHEVLVVDDGSSDGSAERLTSEDVQVLRQPSNLGRGAARHRAMQEANGELVVCCDAKNVLPPDFVSRLLPWFEDPKVAAVYGRIQDPSPRGAVGRWRARHLFKANHPMTVRHQAPLITYGTIVRRSAVLAVGNYNPALRHSEDAELGDRLLAAGYDVVFDPAVPVFCNRPNTLSQVLERYWRWYAGPAEEVSWRGYGRNLVFSVKAMVWQDLKAGDPLAAIISLLCPHYQFWKSRRKRTGDG